MLLNTHDNTGVYKYACIKCIVMIKKVISMCPNVKFKSILRCFHSGNCLFFLSLLFVMVLFSSCFVSVSIDGSSFVVGTSDKVVVNDETELRNALQDVEGPIVIALDKDIKLTKSYISISSGTYVTLTSNNIHNFFKIIGLDGQSTIEVRGGVLVLEGAIITHDVGSNGSGIFVHNSGTLIMSGGEISGNTGIGMVVECIIVVVLSYRGAKLLTTKRLLVLVVVCLMLVLL